MLLILFLRLLQPWGKGHTTLNPNSAAYWEFSWDEMAKYDVPANVDFVLGHTGLKTLSYVGHSQVLT